MRPRTVALAAVIIMLLSLSFSLACSLFDEDDLFIETRSPMGTYTLLFQGKINGTSTIAGSSEVVKLTVKRDGASYFVKDQFFGEPGLGPHFRGKYPVLEWLNDSAIRLGEEISSQPYTDRIRILNSTKEILSVLEIFYINERFLILDFKPEAQLVLSASPQFRFDSSPAPTVVYRALNLATKRERQGMIEGKRKHPSEGPLDLELTINQQ
jgi:hypothetical protein